MYVLLVHGQAGLCAEHWQGWLAGTLARSGETVEIPEFPDPDRPVLADWLTELREHLDLAPTGMPRIVVAHALGATLWLHHAATTRVASPAHRMDRVLLVAPQSSTTEHVPLDAAGLRRVAATTRLVAGEPEPARRWAAELDVELDLIDGGGQLDPETGYGPWPALLDWVRHDRVPITGR